MKIVNTYPAMMQAYEGSAFSFEKQKAYIDSVFSGISSLLISDAKECLESGDFSWEKDYLPILNAVAQNTELDPNYFHQDADGWKKWCDDHLEEIKSDFNRDLETMTLTDQRYFGDWVKYNGYGDVGYYLGCRFIWYILSEYEFDEIICFDIDMVTKLFNRFIQ